MPPAREPTGTDAGGVNIAFYDHLEVMCPRQVAFARKSWEELGGAEIEPLLRSGAIAILNARWVIDEWKRGGIIRRRQELPDEAFLSVDELINATAAGDLHLAAASYPWMQPDHPDPKGWTLALLGGVLEAYITDGLGDHVWGLFWDFASLHQHPKDGQRTDAENALFKQGLGGLATIYGHQYTTVLRVSRAPDDYPSAYNLPDGANVAAYPERGWCFTETSWSQLTKSSHLSLDLGRLSGNEKDKDEIVRAATVISSNGGGRAPPRLPEDFVAALEAKTFTNGKDDKPLVAMLYSSSFSQQFRSVKVLHYEKLGWGDTEAVQLAKVLGSGALQLLTTLLLDHNQIGEVGITALAEVVRNPAVLPMIKTIGLRAVPISDDAKQTLVDAMTARGGKVLLEATRSRFS